MMNKEIFFYFQSFKARGPIFLKKGGIKPHFNWGFVTPYYPPFKDGLISRGFKPEILWPLY
jgi:hypothetical protein